MELSQDGVMGIAICHPGLWRMEDVFQSIDNAQAGPFKAKEGNVKSSGMLSLTFILTPMVVQEIPQQMFSKPHAN